MELPSIYENKFPDRVYCIYFSLQSIKIIFGGLVNKPHLKISKNSFEYLIKCIKQALYFSKYTVIWNQVLHFVDL